MLAGELGVVQLDQISVAVECSFLSARIRITDADTALTLLDTLNLLGICWLTGHNHICHAPAAQGHAIDAHDSITDGEETLLLSFTSAEKPHNGVTGLAHF